MNSPLLIPLIYPADFEHGNRVAARLVPALSDSPFVVLGWHDNGRLSFAPASLDFAAEREQALRNLRARPNRAPWFEETIAGPKRRAQALLRIGDRTTASDLFDVEFLLEAASRLGADEVFVAAPTQESMLLTADRGLASHLCLTRLHDMPHAEFVIGAQIFRCDAGGLSLVRVARRAGAPPLATGRAERPRPAPAAAVPPLAFDTETPESENDEGLGYMPMGVQVGTGDGEFMLLLALTEPDLASAARKVELLLERRLPRYLQTPEFGGRIHFSLNPEFVHPTTKNRQRFAAILQQRSRELLQLRLTTASGKPLSIDGSIGPPGSPDEPDAPRPPPERESARATNEPSADEHPAHAALAELRRLAAEVRAGKTVAIESSGAEARSAEAPRVKAARLRAEQAEAVRAEAARVQAEQAEAARVEAARIEADPLLRAAREAARQQRGEMLVRAGAVLTTAAVTLRYVLALFMSGSDLLGEAETFMPFACLLLFALWHFGFSYGRFGLLALAAVSACSSGVRWLRAAHFDVPFWLHLVLLTTGFAFVFATICLAGGRTRGKPPSLTAAAALRAALGLAFGVGLSAATGLADLRPCIAQNRAFAATHSCAVLNASACAKAEGCKVITPTCVTTTCTDRHFKCIPPCVSVDGTCRSVCRRLEGTPWTRGRPTCEPQGLCKDVGGACVDSCSVTEPEECRTRPFCRLLECAGSAPLACGDYSSEACPLGLCSNFPY